MFSIAICWQSARSRRYMGGCAPFWAEGVLIKQLLFLQVWVRLHVGFQTVWKCSLLQDLCVVI